MLEHSPRFAQARARQALRSAGLPFDGELVPAASTRNEVFLTPDYAVRINRQPNQRLRRESILYRHLPRLDWAPEAIHTGGEVGADYLIVARKPGEPLSRCWPTMSTGSRREAVRQLGEALEALHTTPATPDVPRLEVLTHLIDPRCVSPLVPLLLAIDELKGKPNVDHGVLEDIEQMTLGASGALEDFDQRTLIHGDLSFENILWDGSTISGILDFEWCRGASNDMELDVLLRFCAFPFAHVAEDYEQQTRAADYVEVPVWLAEFRPDLFAHPRLRERLMLYCIAFDVRDLSENLPERGSKLGPLHAMNRLRSMAANGAHLTPFLNRLGVPV